MHVLMSLMTGVGIAFLMLAALLAHEAISRDENTPAASLRNMFQTAVTRTVLGFDRDVIFGAAVPAVLFLVLPGAALLNAVLGGSPFLLICYLLMAGSTFVHMLLVGRAGAVTALLAGLTAVLALFVLPYYAVWSLTSHMLKGSPAEGAVSGLLIAMILYAANAGVWTLLHAAPDTGSDGWAYRFTGAALAALPFGYLLYWFVVFGSVLVGVDLEQLRGWGSLVVFSVGFAICAGLFKAVLDAGARRQRGSYTAALGSGGIGALAILAAHAVH